MSDPGETKAADLRVLMTLHHAFDGDSGASGVTLRIARALRAAGCEVDLLGFDQVYTRPVRSVAQSARFPLHVASHLFRFAHRYDVVDASSGDAWLWARLGRPSRKRAKVAIVTRSHGLEHVADARYRAQMEASRENLRPRYRLYHGGYRLWEVETSMRLAERSILLNHEDYDVARSSLGIPSGRLRLIAHGLREDSPLFARRVSASVPLEIAFIGSWIARKGVAAVASAFESLRHTGRDARLRLLGTALEAEAVLPSFAPASRPFVTVVPRFKNEDLTELLGDASILLMLSRSEGFGLGLIEGMAAGLVPIATRTGAAPDAIVDGENGFLVDIGEGPAGAAPVVERLALLADDPERRVRMGLAARRTARRYDAAGVAAQTIEVYRAAAADL